MYLNRLKILIVLLLMSCSGNDDLFSLDSIENFTSSSKKGNTTEQAVEVYRLVTRGTIEEKIQELQEKKKNLVSEVLDGTESRGSLSLAEIREILGIS